MNEEEAGSDCRTADMAGRDSFSSWQVAVEEQISEMSGT